MNKQIEDVVFHNAVTEAGNGFEYYVGEYGPSIVSVEISGTATSFEAVFEGKRFDDWKPKFAINEATAEVKLNGLINTRDQSFQVDVTGLSYFRVKINSVTGGNLTVNGRFIK